MRLIFFGTTIFSKIILEKIVLDGYDIACLVTQIDKPSGRGMRISPNLIKSFAQSHSIPILQPEKLICSRLKSELIRVKPSVIIVAAYGKILPEEFLSIPNFGCINVHASLLPKWRGAAPIQRSIEAGDEEIGISIIRMDSKIDTGNILSRQSINTFSKNSGELEIELANLGGNMMLSILEQLKSIGRINEIPQTYYGSHATYAKKLIKSDLFLNWQQSAQILDNKIRALSPKPGAQAVIQGLNEPIKILSSFFIKTLEHSDAFSPGECIIHNKQVYVKTAEGFLKLIKIQRPGKKITGAESLIHLLKKQKLPSKEN